MVPQMDFKLILVIIQAPVVPVMQWFLVEKEENDRFFIPVYYIPLFPAFAFSFPLPLQNPNIFS